MDNEKKQSETSKDERIAALEQRLVVAESSIEALYVATTNLECEIISLQSRPID